ncbi:MAG: activase [Deltaproteobacteria bacterium]|nr:MAG: activase [Deltaproteobacteria bacterium]
MTSYYAGCDIGSTTGKTVIINDAGEVVSSAMIDSTIDPEVTAIEVLSRAIGTVNGLEDMKELDYIVGTGYGRIELSFAHKNISEITCHAAGANSVDPLIRTVIDIGGQDCKAIALGDGGNVIDFVMNDKCAAGTGRFFEAVSRAFQMSLNDFSQLSLDSTKPIPISSQCSVFAESEIISLISQRKKPADIAAGVQLSVAKRLLTLARRIGVKERLTVTGGCAKNVGLIKALREGIDIEVVELPFDAQLIGALGAAILARRDGVQPARRT